MSAGNFNGPCFPFTLHEEGGLVFTDDPRDRGGATFAGITLAGWREWTRNPNATADELRNLTLDQVTAFYGARVWQANRCDDLPAGVDFWSHDAATNTGHHAAQQLQAILGLAADGWIGPATVQAVRQADGARIAGSLGALSLAMLQGALGLRVDGACGPITRAAAAAHPMACLLVAMHAAARAAYAQDAGFATYGRGWLARLGRRTARALPMVGAHGVVS